jgi:hypothetical protein
LEYCQPVDYKCFDWIEYYRACWTYRFGSLDVQYLVWTNRIQYFGRTYRLNRLYRLHGTYRTYGTHRTYGTYGTYGTYRTNRSYRTYRIYGSIWPEFMDVVLCPYKFYNRNITGNFHKQYFFRMGS